MAHTSGPWNIGYGGTEDTDYAVIVSPHAKHPVANLEPLGYTLDNARLIAAAPDLLALAKHIHAMADDHYLTGHPEWNEIVREAMAAIAKAEGR